MAAFTLTADLTAPENHWAELVAHPELLFGHNAPDLVAGTDYVARSPFGSGGSGRIEAVQPGRVEFTWGGADWPQPGRFVVYAADDLIVDARAVPDFEAEPTRAHWERMLHIAADFLNTPDRAVDSPVEAVLFDADGVLQWPRPGWLEEMTTLGGPTFVLDAFAAERDCLAGGAELAPLLTGLLTASGTGATVEQVLQVWHDIVVDPDALALVGRLRDSGLIVCLATNQQSLRGAHMRDALALDAHFDRAFYSFEVGHAKPSQEYFRHIVDVLGLPAERVVFVDDAPANVLAARLVGLRGVLHRVSDGAAGLAADLAGVGVRDPALGSADASD